MCMSAVKRQLSPVFQDTPSGQMDVIPSSPAHAHAALTTVIQLSHHVML